LSFGILLFGILLFGILLFGILSFGILSFVILSFDILDLAKKHRKFEWNGQLMAKVLFQFFRKNGAMGKVLFSQSTTSISRF
jgi:hypothetical protein